MFFNKKFSYKEFIDEVKQIIVEGNELFNLNHNSSRFREWRFKLTDLIGNIEKESYVINCDINNRMFGLDPMDNSTANRYVHPYEEQKIQKELQEEYNMELRDTLTELETIVSNHQKYGEPQKHTIKRNEQNYSIKKITPIIIKYGVFILIGAFLQLQYNILEIWLEFKKYLP